MSTFSAESTESTEPVAEGEDGEASEVVEDVADVEIAAESGDVDAEPVAEGEDGEVSEVVEDAADVEIAAESGDVDADAEPVAEGEEPVAEGEEPVAEGEEPVAEGEEPVAEGEEPVAEGEETVIEGEELIETQAEVIESAYDKPGKWYVVHTQSGYEKKVKQNIEARTSSMNMEEAIHEVVIPMEDVMEFRNGKKVVVQKKVFPGYLLVRCRLSDDAWYVVRNTPGVTGFVGAGNKPSPLPRKDVEAFLQTKPEGEEIQKPMKPRLAYEMDETVRVKEGPFADFSGQIIEINEDQLKVKVLVNIFGRDTPVELEFAQVAKL